MAVATGDQGEMRRGCRLKVSAEGVGRCRKVAPQHQVCGELLQQIVDHVLIIRLGLSLPDKLHEPLHIVDDRFIMLLFTRVDFDNSSATFSRVTVLMVETGTYLRPCVSRCVCAVQPILHFKRKA